MNGDKNNLEEEAETDDKGWVLPITIIKTGYALVSASRSQQAIESYELGVESDILEIEENDDGQYLLVELDIDYDDLPLRVSAEESE